MWVSQSYLTNLRADGSVAAYFLFESYRDDHKRLEAQIRPKLGELALSFGDAAHVFVPSEAERGTIEKEFNNWIQRRGLHGILLPGILVLDHAMADERSLHGCSAYISFDPLLKNPAMTDALLADVKQAFQDVSAKMEKDGIGLERTLANLQLRPGLWGFGYDFKPHLIRAIKKWR